MQYRRFGKLDWHCSALGFGAMRLPVIGNDPAQIDEDTAVNMLRYAIDQGVNYVDTAYPYHSGKSEPVVGKALKGGYREKVKLATKLPSWQVENAADFDRFFNQQLERLQLPKVNFYLLHGLNKETWHNLRDLGILRWAEKQIAAGRFDHLGFSFHDNFPVFKEILDSYDGWTLCQMQYNYMDEEFQAGTRGLKYAAGKGLAVVVMEPLRGGRLTKKPPERIARLWESAPRTRSQADWGLRWVWSHPEVSVVLSGMSTMAQVKENVALAASQDYTTLSAAELDLIGKVRDAYRDLTPIPCTDCWYCQPCPNDVAIPTIFELYNAAIMYDDLRQPQIKYNGPTGLKSHERGDQCTECGECVEKCPQHITIPDWLKKAHALLKKG